MSCKEKEKHKRVQVSHFDCELTNGFVLRKIKLLMRISSCCELVWDFKPDHNIMRNDDIVPLISVAFIRVWESNFLLWEENRRKNNAWKM